MPKAYIYLRCSHEDSAKSQLGLEDQQARAREFAASLPVREVIELRDEIVSAYKTRLFQRPAGKRLLEAQEGDYVVFAFLDRGFRNVPDMRSTLEYLRNMGVHVHFVDIGESGDERTQFVVENMHAVFAEYRSLDTSIRTKAGLARARARTGLVNGTTPIGFKKVYNQRLKKHVAVPCEKARKRAADMLAAKESGMSDEKIAMKFKLSSKSQAQRWIKAARRFREEERRRRSA